MAAKAAATKVRTYAAGVSATAAMRIAPTRTTPWIELAPDIIGVCRVAGILLMTSNPTSRARTNRARLLSSWALISLPFRKGLGCGVRCGDSRLGDDLGRGSLGKGDLGRSHPHRVDDLVGGVEIHDAVAHDGRQERCDVACVGRRGARGHLRGQVARADHRDAV